MPKVKPSKAVQDFHTVLDLLAEANSIAKIAQKDFKELASSFKGIIKTIDGLLDSFTSYRGKDIYKKGLRPLKKLESGVYDVSKMYAHDRKKPKPNLGAYFFDIHNLLEQAIDLLEDLDKRSKGTWHDEYYDDRRMQSDYTQWDRWD